MKKACVSGEPFLSGDLLKSVSRSFFLTIRWLPKEMRPGVALGYLLARATDSVADTSTAAPEVCEATLRSMGAAVAGTLDDAGVETLLHSLAGAMAPAQENPAERELLCRFGDCLEWLNKLPKGQADLVRKVLATIVEGQLWDITYFRQNRTVTEDAQTRLYTYQVAGCVGQFWTELGLETMSSGFCDPSRKQVMMEAGIRYGCGLQLINILRDRAEDAARGRSYLCSPPADWMRRAERYLHDGLDYSTRLRCFRLRFTGMLPALIGLRTLRLMNRARAGVRVKVPRRTVYACLLQAVWLSIFPRAF